MVFRVIFADKLKVIGFCLFQVMLRTDHPHSHIYSLKINEDYMCYISQVSVLNSNLNFLIIKDGRTDNLRISCLS